MADFNPDAYIAEKTAKPDAAAFDPDKYLAEKTAIPPPVAAKPEGITGAMGDAYKGLLSVVSGGGDSIGSRVPIIGPLGKNLGERFRAGVDWAANMGEKPYGGLLQHIRDQEEADQARFAAEHPGANVMRNILGGAGAVAIPVPGAGIPGAAGIAARIGGAATGAGTDALLRTEDAAAVKQSATLGGLIQGGFEALPLVGKVAAPIGRTIADKAGPAGEWLATKAANIVGGVDEGNFGKYLANRERINQAGALDPEHVKDMVDSGVAGVVGDKVALTGEAAKLEEGINAAYAKKQAELVGQTTPLAKAKEMSASLESQKTYLGSLSEQADDALVRSGASFKKAALVAAIEKIGGGEGVAIGDEAHAALSKLQNTKDRIIAQLPDDIPAVQMRSVLQQLRKDVSFDQGAGEFNDTLNGMRKEFTAQISGALKKQVPEYADYMSRMADLSENLGTMNRYFGDESKALGSLEVLRKGGARAQIIEDALKNHATVNADQAMLHHLDQVNQSHELLGRIKGGEDLRGHFFPKEWNALQEAQANAQMGADVASPIERLGQNRTQSVIRNQGGKVANIEDARALEALSQSTGENFPQMIEDKNVFDSFGKASPGGARRTAAGGFIGGALGHMVGQPIQGAAMGSAVGGALDRYGPAMTKVAVDVNAELAAWLAARGVNVQQFAEAVRSSPMATVAPVIEMNASRPSWTDLMQKAEKQDPEQQKRDAIKRRIGE